MVETEALEEFDLFAGLDETDLAGIARRCRRHSYEKGACVFTGGGSATDVYLLEAGRVAIQVEFIIYQYEFRAAVYTVRKGETFGWSALVPPHRLTASARCLEKADVITLKGAELMDFLDEHARMGYVVMKNLSGIISSRLAATTCALRHEMQKLMKEKVAVV